MTNERWERVAELFEQALEREEGERTAFLEEACAEDEDLLREVRSLVAADGRSHSLFEGVALDAVSLLDEVARDTEALLGVLDRSGARVGPYRLLRRLGAGGMGEVYLAEREDGQFRRHAALKLIKPGLDTERVVRRFRAERQILARLQHPNIARLFDGGVTEAGLPYFAMEYVEGEPIDVYCDRRRLSIDERLALFTTVCRAVHFAHSNLVIHRDLKPENILVADGEDGRAVVKLLDFGIAKVLEEDGAATLTQAGGRVMTPAYASPEQVRGEAVSTATDVYSLGVVLYELLAGCRPFGAEGASSEALSAAILTEEPERPSTVVAHASETRAGASGEDVGHARSLPLERLRRRLSGDLDVICLKALRKAPGRRYGSAESFGSDVERHLAGLPVTARPDTLVYRTRKFVGRHRRGVLTAAAVTLLVAALVAFYTVRLAAERDHARVEAEKSAAVASFLEDLFAVANPSESRGATVTAREILDAGAQRIEEDLAGQPDVQVEMMTVIARVMHGLGLYEEEKRMLESALVIAQGRPDGGEAIPSIMKQMGRLWMKRGDYVKADSLFRLALDGYARRFGAESMEAVGVLNDLGVALKEQYRLEEAETVYRQALAINRRIGEDTLALSVSMNNLAELYRRMENFPAAESLHRENLALARRIYGEPHPNVAASMNNLALTLIAQEKLEEAEPFFRASLRMRQTLYGADHPDLAPGYRNLGGLMKSLGKYASADTLYHRALAINRKHFGADHPRVLSDVNVIGSLKKAEGDYDAADSLFRYVLALREKRLGPDDPLLAQAVNNVASVLSARGDHAGAAVQYRKALDLWRRATGGRNTRTAFILDNVASALEKQGAYARAEGFMKERIDLLTELVGAEDRRTRAAMNDLAELYDAWDRPAEAARVRAMLPAD
jgi:serine/threonine-protein kinase